MSTNDESIDLDEAIKDFEDMIAGKPDAGYVLTNGDVLTLLKRLREAEARIEKVRKLVDPDTAYGHPDDWEQGYNDACDEIHAALTEGDEQ